MGRRHPTLFLFALAAGACATAPSAAPQQSADGATKAEQELVCRRERVTGSNIPRKVCHYEADRRSQREAARTVLRRSSPNAKGGEGP